MRIVSLSPSSTELLFAIGAGGDIVGVTQLCDYPSEAKQKEILGSWLHPDAATIKSLAPDLIVTTMIQPEEIRSYGGRGDFIHLEPTNLSSVLETILILGRATGRNQAAELLVEKMQKDFEVIRSQAPVQKLDVYCEMWPNPPMQAGNWVPELVEIAGGKPIGSLYGRPSAPVAVDALQSGDPDVMIFHWCNENEKPDLERIRNRPGWSTLRALQGDACVFLSANLLNRPGPRLVDGAHQLQDVLYKHQHVR